MPLMIRARAGSFRWLLCGAGLAIAGWGAPSASASQILQRSPSETIPSGARLLRISAHSESRSADARESESEMLSMLERLPSKVTSVGQIEAVVALLNKLEVGQPGLRLCPLDRGETSVALDFYATSQAAPLAQADIEPEGCGGVALTIGGVPQPRLEEGGFLISEIGRALGVNPAAGPPVGPTPRISGVRMSRARFAVEPRDMTVGVEPGTKFLFHLSAPAEVSVAISRLPRDTRYAQTCLANAARPRRLRVERCVRTVPVAGLTRKTEREGDDGIAFSGKVGRRSLAPGRYVALLRARDTGGSSQVAGVEFEIAR